jgi:hypothetical protein
MDRNILSANLKLCTYGILLFSLMLLTVGWVVSLIFRGGGLLSSDGGLWLFFFSGFFASTLAGFLGVCESSNWLFHLRMRAFPRFASLSSEVFLRSSLMVMAILDF